VTLASEFGVSRCTRSASAPRQGASNLPFTDASVSPKSFRRSEWPMITLGPASNHAPLFAPVNAPQLQYRSARRCNGCLAPPCPACRGERPRDDHFPPTCRRRARKSLTTRRLRTVFVHLPVARDEGFLMLLSQPRRSRVSTKKVTTITRKLFGIRVCVSVVSFVVAYSNTIYRGSRASGCARSHGVCSGNEYDSAVAVTMPVLEKWVGLRSRLGGSVRTFPRFLP